MPLRSFLLIAWRRSPGQTCPRSWIQKHLDEFETPLAGLNTGSSFRLCALPRLVKFHCRQHRSSAACSPGPQESWFSLARPRQCSPSPLLRFKRTQSRQYMDNDWTEQPFWRLLLQGRDTRHAVKWYKHAVCLSGRNSCDRQDGARVPNRLPYLHSSLWPPTTGKSGQMFRGFVHARKRRVSARATRSKIFVGQTLAARGNGRLKMNNHRCPMRLGTVRSEATPRYGPRLATKSGILQHLYILARLCVRKRRVSGVNERRCHTSMAKGTTCGSSALVETDSPPLWLCPAGRTLDARSGQGGGFEPATFASF